MICKNCNVHVEDGSAVCPVCGGEVEPESALEETASEVTSVKETVPETTAEVPVPAKRKTWVKVAAIVACVALFLGLAASVWYGVNGGFAPRANNVSYKDQYYAEKDKAVKAADDVIATVGDKGLTNGQFQVFYWMNIYEFCNQYSDYLSYFGLDLTMPLYEQYAEEDSTWEQFFIDSTLNTWHSYQSLLLYAQEDGYVMSDALAGELDAVIASMEATALQYGIADVNEMVQEDLGLSADMDDYMHYLEVYYSGIEYVEGLYDELAPTDAEIEAYFDANADALKTDYDVDKESGRLIDVRHILICPKGGTEDENGDVTYSEQEWDDCLKEAEALLKQWQEGDATEESFALLATENTEDPGSQSTGGLYSYVYEGQMVPTFNDWCFDESRQNGDTAIVKTDYGYHIMYFVYGEEGWIRRAEESLLADACTEIMEKAMEEYPIEINYKKIVLSKADMAS